jgi:hypothetical protein
MGLRFSGVSRSNGTRDGENGVAEILNYRIGNEISHTAQATKSHSGRGTYEAFMISRSCLSLFPLTPTPL